MSIDTTEPPAPLCAPWISEQPDPTQFPDPVLVDPAGPDAVTWAAECGVAEADRWLLNPTDVEYAVWTAGPEDLPYLGTLVGQPTTGAVYGIAAAEEPDPIARATRLDGMKAMIDAEQLRLLAGFHSMRVAADHQRGIRASDVGRTGTLEVAMARCVASNTAARQLALASAVVEDYPSLLDGLEAGVLTLAGVARVVAAGQPLTPPDRDTLARAIVDYAHTCSLTPTLVDQAARAVAIRLDADAAANREAHARRGRTARLDPLPDGVAELIIRARAEDAVAALNELARQAQALKAAGDPRSLAQLRADLAIDLITGTHHQSSDDNHDTGDEEDDGRPAGHEPTDQPGADHDDEPAHDTDTSAEAPSADSSVGRPGELVPGVPNPDLGHGPRRPSEVQVVIGADSLFGGGREPAMIRGYGSISPHLGCYLAGSDKVWLRQLVADPCDGHLLAMSTRTRLFRGELRKFLTWRDQTCAINTCGRPGEHADHVTPHALGGPTSAEDGQMLCSGDNFAKEHPDVVVTRNPDDSTTWRMPTGHEYTQHPPPVLGFGTGDPPRHRLYELFAEDQGDTDDLSPPF